VQQIPAYALLPRSELQKHIAIAIRCAIDLRNMLIGYARISTSEQDTKAQVAALQSAGCVSGPVRNGAIFAGEGRGQ